MSASEQRRGTPAIVAVAAVLVFSYQKLTTKRRVITRATHTRVLGYYYIINIVLIIAERRTIIIVLITPRRPFFFFKRVPTHRTPLERAAAAAFP